MTATQSRGYNELTVVPLYKWSPRCNKRLPIVNSKVNHHTYRLVVGYNVAKLSILLTVHHTEARLEKQIASSMSLSEKKKLN